MQALGSLQAVHRSAQSFKWQPGNTFLSTPGSAMLPVLAYLLILAVLKMTVKRPLSVPVWIPAAYNLAMSAGSLAMFLGTAIGSYKVTASSRSVTWLVCLPPGTKVQGPLFFWSYAYFLSKYVEFLDTILLCLKGKPLSFLHVFHHSVVVPMAFLWLAAAQSLQHVALLTNTGIHVLMYFYYFLTTLGIRPAWKRIVTDGQIVQFVFSFAISIPFWVLHLSGHACSGFEAMLFNAAFNLLLLVLFVNFHRRNYAKRERTKAA